MPSNIIKSFAEKSGKSIFEVEKLWQETKEEARKKFQKIDHQYWAYVTATVRIKLGLNEAKLDELVELLIEFETNEKI